MKKEERLRESGENLIPEIQKEILWVFTWSFPGRATPAGMMKETRNLPVVIYNPYDKRN